MTTEPITTTMIIIQLINVSWMSTRSKHWAWYLEYQEESRVPTLKCCGTAEGLINFGCSEVWSLEGLHRGGNTWLERWRISKSILRQGEWIDHWGTWNRKDTEAEKDMISLGKNKYSRVVTLWRRPAEDDTGEGQFVKDPVVQAKDSKSCTGSHQKFGKM